MCCRDPRWYVWLPALLLAPCIPLYLIGLQQADWRLAFAALLAIAFLQYSQTPLLLAITQNMITDRMRAMASALVGIVANLFAAAGGPWFVGRLSDALARNAYPGDYAGDCLGRARPTESCGAASAAGLTMALIVTAAFFAWAILHLVIAARWIGRDLSGAEE